MDLYVLEGVLDGTLCPICELKVRQKVGTVVVEGKKESAHHLLDCRCSEEASRNEKLADLMEWANKAILAERPTPGMSDYKRDQAIKNLRAVQGSCRSLLNELLPEYSVAATITHTDGFGRTSQEVITDRRDLHGAITDLEHHHRKVTA